MLKQLTLAMLATVAFGAAVSTASAAVGPCPRLWACGANGRSMDGVASRPADDGDRYEARSGCGLWACGMNGTSQDGVAGRFSDDADRYQARDGGCDEWGCGLNGTALAGTVAQGEDSDRYQARGGGCDFGCGMNGASSTGVAGRPSDDDDRYQARGGDCGDWGCGVNGASYQGTLLTGTNRPTRGVTVNAVILRSGEMVDLAPATSETGERQ